jgi:hypothetical protein
MNEIINLIDRPARSVTVTFGRALAAVIPALETYRGIQAEAQSDQFHWPHDAKHVAEAKRVRNARLPKFIGVQYASNLLASELRRKLDRRPGAAIISGLYRSLGVKAGAELEGLLQGALDVILESDRVGRATGDWKPIGATPAVVALASRKILQTAVFPPKPSELANACRDARHTLAISQAWCEGWLEDLQAADALLLEFAREEWRQPYLLPHYQPMLAPMLDAHECADISEIFEDIVESEKAKAASA